ncbi:hypothetical protein HOD20_04670 [archaeon]|jgi:hypothetical protein|nr:hypothetical protein [archaeon]MBT4351800.1 hypothetical protein [archaeon]MBT4647309.1 hypothetical protein [archaeon]MBT6821128.1 hypothetical protein [archaeon]MBT7391704.1 hypothetical protein [archaeon]
MGRLWNIIISGQPPKEGLLEISQKYIDYILKEETPQFDKSVYETRFGKFDQYISDGKKRQEVKDKVYEITEKAYNCGVEKSRDYFTALINAVTSYSGQSAVEVDNFLYGYEKFKSELPFASSIDTKITKILNESLDRPHENLQQVLNHSGMIVFGVYSDGFRNYRNSRKPIVDSVEQI